MGAFLSSLHDPVVVLGVWAWAQLTFDLTVLASILALIGYSINDTVVVFDRVREVFRKVRGLAPMEAMNLSINETLSRTLMTSGSTLLPVAAMYAFGGPGLAGFSLAFLIGIVIGSYSSIYVAGGIALDLGLSQSSLVPSPKSATVDDMP